MRRRAVAQWWNLYALVVAAAPAEFQMLPRSWIAACVPVQD